MSFFESFLGGAAQAGTNILQDQMKNEAAEEQARRLAKFQEEIAIERMKTIADMKRSMDLKAGQEISAEAEKVGRSRVDAEMDKNNPIADASTWTPEMEAARNQGKQGIIASATNAEKLGDSANAALKLGYNDQAKEIRGHQQIEMQATRDGRREEHDIKREELADARYQTDVEWRKERAAVEDRLATVREQLAGAAEARAGRAEKNQTTAMDKAELNSTRLSLQSILKDVALQDEKVSAQMVAIQSKMADPMLSPEQKKPFEDQLKTLEKRFNTLDAHRASVRNELYSLSGIEPPKEKGADPAKKIYQVPTEASIKALMDNPGKLKEFEASFGAGAVPLEFYQKNKAPESGSIIASSRAGGGERNPYVDAKGRPVRIEGDDTSALDRNLPKAKEAIKAVGESVSNAADAAQVRYLKQKIADGSLSVTERARAKRLGLIE